MGTGLHNGSCTSLDTYTTFNCDNSCDIKNTVSGMGSCTVNATLRVGAADGR